MVLHGRKLLPPMLMSQRGQQCSHSKSMEGDYLWQNLQEIPYPRGIIIFLHILDDKSILPLFNRFLHKSMVRNRVWHSNVLWFSAVLSMRAENELPKL